MSRHVLFLYDTSCKKIVRSEKIAAQNPYDFRRSTGRFAMPCYFFDEKKKKMKNTPEFEESNFERLNYDLIFVESLQ